MKTRGRPPHPDILTPREFDVLSLLREGLSNPEIAQRLGIRRETAKYHVSEILSKLGVEGREEAALWQRETHRPWWATAALAPAAWLWGKAGAAAPSPSVLAAGAAGVLIGASVCGLAFIAFLLANGGGDDGGSQAASLLATATPSERDGVVDPYTVTMHEVGGSGANGAANWTAQAQLGGFAASLEIPTLGLSDDPYYAVLPGTCAMPPFNFDTPLIPRAGGFNTGVRPGLGGAEDPDTYTDGFHSIVVYNAGVVVSCGDIPAVSADDGTALTEAVDFVELTVEEWGGSGIAGDVVLWTRHDGVGVAAMANVAPHWWYDFHIHSGSCVTPGRERLPVRGLWESKLTGTPGPDDASGGVFGFEGSAEATGVAALQDGNHYIDVHAPSDGGAIVACADIPEA